MKLDETWEVQELEKELAEMEAAFEVESSRHSLHEGIENRKNNIEQCSLGNSWVLDIVWSQTISNSQMSRTISDESVNFGAVRSSCTSRIHLFYFVLSFILLYLCLAFVSLPALVFFRICQRCADRDLPLTGALGRGGREVDADARGAGLRQQREVCRAIFEELT